MEPPLPARLPYEPEPAGAWFASVRRSLPDPAWDRVRAAVLAESGRRCAACRGANTLLAVHAVWRYDDERHVQALDRLIALCPACHHAAHLREAVARGQGAQAAERLALVNGWTAEQADAAVEAAFEIWRERSRHTWRVTLDAVDRYGAEAPESYRDSA